MNAEPTADPDALNLEPQNPNATAGEHSTPPESVSVPEYDRVEERLGEDYGDNNLVYPWVDDRDWQSDLDALSANQKLTDMWHHGQTGDGFNGMDFRMKASYPGSVVVPVTAYRVEEGILYVKTQAYHDDAGYWRDGENPMFEMTLNIGEMTRDEFDAAMIEFTNAAYPYTRRYVDRTHGTRKKESVSDRVKEWKRQESAEKATA